MAVTLREMLRHHLSLLHGWIPITVQALAGIALVAAVCWGIQRGRYVWVPWAALCGIALTAAAYWYVESEGLAGNPAPDGLWVWIGLTGTAAGVVVAGWRGATWWRRLVAASAVPLCLLSAALALNLWTGYFPSVQTAWNQFTAGPLPDQTDQVTVLALQHRHQIPAKGTVVPVQIGDSASGFKHRDELVYLPPAWYATDPPPPMPTIMMVGGEFNTPADWLRIGNAVAIADNFAAAHGGNAPVLVFVDAGGTFNNDTECVNGRRGNSADHLTKDVVPFMISKFGVGAHRESWGVVGFSMGGTCAVDLAVMHPDMFSAFEDIAGDIAPNSGTKDETISRLFGGNAAAYASFDPTNVITRHGTYNDVAGWFAVNSEATPEQRSAASSLCALGNANGITCAVVAAPGRHDWTFASQAFATALPWMAGQLRTPGVPPTALPTPPPPPPIVQVAAK